MGKLTGEGPEKRIDRQIRTLQEKGYKTAKDKIKAYKPTDNDFAAEQSGVKLEEPLNHGKTRDRWKLTVVNANQ